MERGLNMKKVLFLITLFFAMLFATSTFAIEGEGTEESPFLITTQEELLLINDFPDCHFKLMNDIELQGEWTPLCYGDSTFKGSFDGNNKSITNLTITTPIMIDTYLYMGFIIKNYGEIKNLTIETSSTGINYNENTSNSIYIGIISAQNNSNSTLGTGRIYNCSTNGNITYDNVNRDVYSYIGGITGSNNGVITYSNSSVIQNITMDTTYSRIKSDGVYVTIRGGTSYSGGITGKGGSILFCKSTANITSTASSAYVGGISGSSSEVSNSYFIGTLTIPSGSSKLNPVAGGIVATSSSNITNCYAVASFSIYNSATAAGICKNTSEIINNSFYDSTISGLTDTDYGTPKSTLAMEMKRTYTDAGWDFDNVWGISSDINNGYPYLLWEYVDNSSANTEIIGVTSTDNSLKFISEVQIEGTPEISTFGTAFIPLWLFETGSTDTATVSYDNSKYNIQGGQTFGATLTGIPESCKNMEIVGKSFIKDTDGNYTWSTAKYSSVDDTILNSLE